MSANQYAAAVRSVKLRKADRTWFPRWVARFASSLGRSRSARLDFSEQSVIRFLQSLRDRGIPAWQRLQATRAIESYRNLVLQSETPSLFEICRTLERIAARERQLGTDVAMASGDDRELVGQLDPNEPKIVREMRAELRLMHYANFSCWMVRACVIARDCGCV